MGIILSATLLVLLLAFSVVMLRKNKKRKESNLIKNKAFTKRIGLVNERNTLKINGRKMSKMNTYKPHYNKNTRFLKKTQ